MGVKDMQNNIRTDLAVELNEEISRKAGRLKGIIVNQHKDKDTGIEVTSLKVTNKAGERMIGKPMGTYITIEARRINEMNEDYNNNVTQILKNYISELIGELLKNKKVKDNGKNSRQDNNISRWEKYKLQKTHKSFGGRTWQQGYYIGLAWTTCCKEPVY